MNLFRFGLVAGALAFLLVVALPANAERGVRQTSNAITQLTTDPAVDVRPAWSPDGRQIAFQSNRAGGNYHIYLMNADGSQQRALTQGKPDDRHPSWTPDGKSILFDSDNGTLEEIWSVNIADGALKQITHIGALSSFPAASPDGQRISFYVYQNESLNLWTARIDGSDAKPLTRDLASASNNQCTFACHSAAWSPDNQSLVYTDGTQDVIWMVQSDGSNPRDIIPFNNEIDHFPWFLPDGRLGFITEHVEPSRAWTDAWAFDFKTQARTLIQGSMSMQGPISWNADNTKVLFHSPRSGNFDIYLIDLTAPSGLDALHGTPIPPAQITAASTSSSAALAQAATAQASASNQVAWYALAGILGLGAIGLIILISRRTMNIK